MEDVDYALRMIPPSYCKWVVKSLRSGNSTAIQVAEQFTTSPQDPAYQPMLRGCMAIKTLPVSYLEQRIKAVEQL